MAASSDGNVAIPDPRVTDLASFHALVNFEKLPPGGFTKVRKLCDAIHGKVIQYAWTRDGEETLIAGKRMPRDRVDMNVDGRLRNEREVHNDPRNPAAPHPEDARTEIGVLSYLRRQRDLPAFLLRMEGVFLDDSCGDVVLATEFIEGGELFQQVCNGSMAGKVRELMWQLLHATRYLHSHNIGHRDISLENVLINLSGSRPEGEVRLMDFGQAVRTRSSCGRVLLRYFRTVGKPYYRSPESYVPRRAVARIRVPEKARPGDVVFGQLLAESQTPDGYLCEVRLPEDLAVPCEFCDNAELWGYEAPSLDVFSLGVCFFILNWCVPPWGLAQLQDKGFRFIYQQGDGGISALLKHWRKPAMPEEAMALLVKMVSPDPRKRPSAEECLASSWFENLGGIGDVPVHSSAEVRPDNDKKTATSDGSSPSAKNE